MTLSQLEYWRVAHLGLKPVNKRDNMRMLELLQHLQLIVDHAFIAADIFFEDDFNCDLVAGGGLRFTDNSICAST